MADDTGAHRALAQDSDATPLNRRGPLRPDNMQSARARASGPGLARLFQFGDAVGLSFASLAAGLIMPMPQTMWLGAPMLALVLLFATGAYAMSSRERSRRRFGRLFIAALAASGGAGTLSGLLNPTFPALGCAVWTAAATVALCASHLMWGSVLRRLRQQGRLTPNLIIVGGTPAAERLIRRALRTRDVNVLGVFDDRRDRVGPDILGVPVLGKTSDMIDHRILPFALKI
eukprot:gene6206-8396_t